jgi:hypothetical protein
VLPHFRLLLRYIACRFFRFGGGQPLHNVQFLISRNLLDIPTAHFLISSPRVFLSVLLNAILLRSCGLRPRFLIPFFHSGFGWCLHPNLRLCEVLDAISTLPWPWRPCSLRRVIPVRRVIFMPTTTNFFRDPEFPRVRTSGWLLRFSAKRRSLCRLFGVLQVSTAAS